MTVGGMGFIPERLLMMMMMITINSGTILPIFLILPCTAKLAYDECRGVSHMMSVGRESVAGVVRVVGAARVGGEGGKGGGGGWGGEGIGGGWWWGIGIRDD